MIEKKDFMYKKPRMLPVLLLLDTSGSMSIDGNIEVMNNAVNEMINDFKSCNSTVADISVGIVCFGGYKAEIFNSITSVNEIVSIKMNANGGTPMGDALRIAKEIVEDKNIIDGRSYRPTIILVSDGQPNDDWEEALDNFIGNGRSAKCHRMSMGIGVAKSTPAYQVLEHFAGSREDVFDAKNARDIRRFFRYVTMSTSARTQSSNPNLIPAFDPVVIPALDDDDDYRPF